MGGPSAGYQVAWGINDFGHLVGQDAGGGFVRIGTSFIQISYAGAQTTLPFSINNADTVVGYARMPNLSIVNFSWSAGNFTTISVPGASNPLVAAISNNGIIAGSFDGGGFILDAGAVSTFNCGGGSTSVLAVNSSGQVVGSFSPNVSNPSVGFLFSGGACTTFEVNGAAFTVAYGINDSGQIYGHWDDTNGNAHGFRRDPNGQITVLDFSDDSDSNFYGKINNIGQVTGTYQNSATGATFAFVLSPSALVDPVPDLLTGSGVTTDGDLLGSLGRGVLGVSADGVTQVVVRIFATAPGQQFTLQLFNDHAPSAGISTDAGEDGGLGIPGGSSFTQNQVAVTSQNTNAGPIAFAIYQAPLDFPRASGIYPTKSSNCPIYTFPPAQDDDGDLACRQVTIQVQGPAGTLQIPVQIVRPPVVAVHGLWSNGSSFANFFTTGQDSSGEPIPDSRFSVKFVNYDTPVGDYVTSTDPNYGPLILSHILANSLGLQYNAASVKQQLDKGLSLVKNGINKISAPVAAVQVDVVAHSMEV